MALKGSSKAVLAFILSIRVAIFILAVSLVIILYSGLSQFHFLGMRLERWNLAYLIILLLFLFILQLALISKKISNLLQLHPCAILFSIVLIIYLSNGITISAGDTRPARYLPFSIIQQGDFYLDEFAFLFSNGRPHFLRYVKHHYVSDYPVGAAVAALPVYFFSAIGSVSPENPIVIELEKITGSLAVALSVVMMYLVLRFLTSPTYSFCLALIFGLCTSNLSVAGQGLWQHGPSQLSLCCALYCLLRGRREPRWIPLSGFFLMFSVVCRPTNLLLIIPIGIVVLLQHRKQALWFLLCGVPPVLFQLWYNVTYFRDPFRSQFSLVDSWETPFWTGATGILFSPGRGLFFYSPLFLFSVLGIVKTWRKPGDGNKRDPLMMGLSIGVLFVLILYSKWQTWWGGELYGPRIISDINPILMIFLVPLAGLFEKRKLWKGVFAVTLLWSLYAHLIGAFAYDKDWHSHKSIHPIPQRFWQWRNNPVFDHSRKLWKRLTDQDDLIRR